jgi:SAM-dependent methyltransferase
MVCFLHDDLVGSIVARKIALRKAAHETNLPPRIETRLRLVPGNRIESGSDLDIPRPPGNHSRMQSEQPPPALTQDEIRVHAWAEVSALLELQLAPLGRRALRALAPSPGEHILDVGCGGGETTLALARAVAPDGAVVGIDLSAAVLAFARRAADGCERVRFVHADAQEFSFEPASFDAAFSRFGVMFFTDPAAAFDNIRRSLKPDGRLTFVCWRALEENTLDMLPLEAASPHLPPQSDDDEEVPSPFAFAKADRVRGILETAGFAEIEITAHDELVGSGDLDSMLAVCSRVGALGKILRERPELRATVLPAVRSALAAHDGPDGVRLNAATWVVTARCAAGL